MSKEVVVLSAVRSAVGSFGGSLKGFEPCELGGLVAKEAIIRSTIDAKAINYASVGNTMPTDSRYPYVARVASIQAGMSMESTAFAVSRLCGSAQQAVISAAQTILCDDSDFALAGGVEVMSKAAYLLPALRNGARMGDTMAIDAMVAVLTDPFGYGHMGLTAEKVADKWGISREMQDKFALESQQKTKAAIEAGYFKGQIVPISIKSRKEEIIFDTDEHPKMTTLEALAAMKPAFKKDGGTVTAGNASGINDAAAFLVLADAKKIGSAKPMARLVSYAIAGVHNEVMGEGPIASCQIALKKAGLKLDQIDLIESNEAFAAQSLAVMKGLNLDPAKTNVNGGAIALGHPVGATGAVIITKLLHEMERRGVKYGMATMCIGGGQGITTIYERL